MTKTQTVYCERTEGGVTNISAVQSAMMLFPAGKRLEVIIRAGATRSSEQNNWLHGCIHILAKELGYSKEEMKSIVKMKFLKREKVDEKTGEVFEYLAETHKLDKMEFSELMEELLHWSDTTFGILLPLPKDKNTQ